MFKETTQMCQVEGHIKWPEQKPTHRMTQKHVEHYDATDI